MTPVPPMVPPNRIYAGSLIDGGQVDDNYQHVASKYNAHTHSEYDTYAPLIGAGMLWFTPTAPVIGGMSWMFANGATLPVSSFPALATALGTWTGGNASIVKLPDMVDRAPFGVGTHAGAMATVNYGPGRGATHTHAVTQSGVNAFGGVTNLLSVSNAGFGFYGVNFLIRVL